MNEPKKDMPAEYARELNKVLAARAWRAWVWRVVWLGLFVAFLSYFDISCSCRPSKKTGAKYPTFSCAPGMVGGEAGE